MRLAAAPDGAVVLLGAVDDAVVLLGAVNDAVVCVAEEDGRAKDAVGHAAPL